MTSPPSTRTPASSLRPAWGASFTACLAYVLTAGAAGATIPFSGGATLTVAPWLLQAIGGTCAAAILTYGGFRLAGLRDDVVFPNTEMRVLEGHGHFAFQDEPAMVAAIIRQFTAGPSPTPPSGE